MILLGMEKANTEDGYLFWNRIDKIRESRGMTLNSLASKTSTTYANMRTQRSSNTIPKAHVIVELSNALDISIDYLLKGKEDVDDIPLVLKNALENEMLTELFIQISKLNAQQLAALSSVVRSYIPETGKRQNIVG